MSTEYGSSQGPSSSTSTSTMKARCGVIGTGHEGSALIRALTKQGFPVRMAHHGGVEELSELANKTGAKPVPMDGVVEEVDMVFLCVPMKEVPHIPKQIWSKCSAHTIIVDCCNYYPSRDGQIRELDDGMPESLWVQKQIGKHVVKAFNSILAHALEEAGLPEGSDNRIALPISGEDPNAKEKVENVVNELGFEPYDAGNLMESWRQQPGSPAYCTNLSMEQLYHYLSKATKEGMPKIRDQAYKAMKESGKPLTWQSLVQLLREISMTPYAEHQPKKMTMESQREAIST